MSRPANEKAIVQVESQTHELSFILEAPATIFWYAAVLLGGLVLGYILTQPINVTQFAAVVAIIVAGTAGIRGLIALLQKQKPTTSPPTAS